MYTLRSNPASSSNKKSVGVTFFTLCPLKEPVHKIQFCFTIFIFVSVLHKCKCNSFVILDPFMPSQAKDFLDISNLTAISPRFFLNLNGLRHVLLLSNMKPVVQKLFMHLFIVFPHGTEISGNLHRNWG